MKHYYFAKKELPNVLEYDAIGFDLESTIVKFNMPELTKHAIFEILEKLYDTKSYPYDTRDFEYDDHIDLTLQNAVWDIDHGTVLKLGEGKIVT